MINTISKEELEERRKKKLQEEMKTRDSVYSNIKTLDDYANENNLTYQPISQTAFNVRTKANKELQNGTAAKIYNYMTSTKEPSTSNTWFNKDAKGGIITKTLGTAGVVAENLVKGVFSAGDKLSDFISYGVAFGADALGYNEYANDVREAASFDLASKTFQPLESTINKYSITGQKLNSVIQSIGESYANSQVSAGFLGKFNNGQVALNTKFGTLNMPITSFITGASSGMTEAYQKGGTNTQALFKGITGGISEAVSEGIFGMFGLGGSDLENKLTYDITHKIENSVARRLKKNLIKASGEGLEEIISYSMNWMFDNAQDVIKDVIDETAADMGEKFDTKEAWENFLGGFLAGGMSASFQSLNNNYKNFEQTMFDAEKANGKMFTNEQREELEKTYTNSKRLGFNLTGEELYDRLGNNEKSKQKVVDALLEERTDKNTTKEEKEKIIEEINDDIKNGRIDANKVIEILGGESYKQITEYNKISNEITELKKKAENKLLPTSELNKLNEQIKNKEEELSKYNTNELKRNALREALTRFNGDSELVKSFEESAKRNQKLQFEGNEYKTDAAKATIESALAAGLNNSTETKKFVETLVKNAEKTGIPTYLTTNEELKQKGMLKEGKIINGYVDGDRIVINSDSPMAIQKIAGHEITHLFEGSELYNNFAAMIKSYAKSNGELEERIKDLKERYAEQFKDLNDTELEAKIENELVSDLVGEYLFTDQEFVNSLYKDNRKWYQKIYDVITDLLGITDKNTRYYKQLKEAKNKLDKAKVIYKQMYQTSEVKTSQDTQYMLSDNQGRELSKEQQEYFKNSKVRDENGKLKVLYHGSPKIGITTFDTNLSGTNTQSGEYGIYFTDSEKFADDFSYERKESNSMFFDLKGEKGTIYEAYMNLTNPLVFSELTSNDIENLYEYASTLGKLDGKEKFVENMIKWQQIGNHQLMKGDLDLKSLQNKYDGFVAKIEVKNDALEYVAFNSNQIKSIDNLNPTENDDIRYSIGEDNSSNNYGLPTFKDLKLQPYTESQFEIFDRNVKNNQNIKSEEKNNNNLTTEEENELEKLQQLDDIGILDDYSRLEELLNKKKYGIDNRTYPELSNNLLKKIGKNFKGLYEYDYVPTTREFNKEVRELSKNGIININDVKELIKSNYNIDRLQKLNDEIYEIQQELRKTSIYVNDYIKNNITDYSNFMQNVYKKLKLSSNGIEVDVAYQELSNSYSDFFPSDITNEIDQFKRIVEVAKMDNNINYDTNLTNEQINENAQYLFDSIKEYQREYRIKNGLEKIDLENLGRPATRMEIASNFRHLAKEQLGDLSKFKDKRKGIQYQINTMKRNLRDIVDQETADKLYKTYFQPITINNAKVEKFINQYNERIEKYNLNNEESTYVQMLGEYKYNPETEITDLQMLDFEKQNEYKIDKAKCEKAVEEFRNIYDELITKINNELVRNGYKEIDYRKGYFPHYIEDKPNSFFGKLMEKMGWKLRSGQLPTDINGITDIFKPGKVWTSFSQRRTGDATDYNALKGFDNYIRGAANTIFHTEDIQKLRALENEIRYQYSEKGVQEQFDEITSNDELNLDQKEEQIDALYKNVRYNPLGNFATEIRNYTDNLANKKAFGDREMERQFGRDTYSIMQNINSRVAANMVGMNISSALTNFIPITQAYSQVSTKNLLKGMKESIMNIIKNDGFDQNSVYLTNRTQQADRLYQTKLDKINDKLGVLFEGIDSFTSNAIVRGKYYDNIENGMSVEEAMTNADEFAKDVMAGRSKGDMPTIFNQTNPITKVFTAFQLEVNNQFGYMFKDLPVDLGKEAKEKLAMALTKMFLAAFFYNWFTEKITGRKSAFSPIDLAIENYETYQNEDLGSAIQDIAKNTAQELPFIGGIMGGGRLPIQAAIPDITDTFGYLATISDDEKSSESKKTAMNGLLKELQKPIYYLAAPFAGGQIKKTIEGLSMYNTNEDKPIAGSYTNSGKLRFTADESVLGKIQAGLFGQYASENARQYFSEDRSALSKNQTQELVDLDIPISDYWKLRDELKTGETTQDKLDILSTTDLTNEQKNIVANNISDRKNKIDMNEYKKYADLEEYTYAQQNPSKYNAIRQVGTYSEYQEYKDNIEAIKEQYTDSTSRKQAVRQYINSLKLNVNQKLILERLAGGYSVKSYKLQLQTYINSLDLTKQEKEELDSVLFS